MHLDDERVQRLLHGELEPSGERQARQHLAECKGCRTRMDEARWEEGRIFALLREVDHPLPDVNVRTLLRARGSPDPGWRRWAAGVVLALAAGSAAYATPGSPLPRLLDRLMARGAPVQSPAEAPAPVTDEPPAAAGIAVSPGKRLTIRFEAKHEDWMASVSLSEGSEVVVRAVEGTATFVSDVDRLWVRSSGPARFEILIPRSAPSVEIVAGERSLFRVDSSRVSTGAERDQDGRYELRLTAP